MCLRIPLIIEENQSAFVLGRLIMDNNLLSSDVFYFMNHNKAKKRGYMALKLDMSKAYDRIKWDFLQIIMSKFLFSQRWISCIMKCVSSTTYQFMVNGELTNTVIPQRGIRQANAVPIPLVCWRVGGRDQKSIWEQNAARDNHSQKRSYHHPLVLYRW